MMKLSTPHNFTKTLLIAAAVFSIAVTGIVFASTAILGQQYPSLAFAQQELDVTDTQTDTATDTTTTTTGDGGANQLAGIISSLQLAPDRLAPEWVTAGYWEMDSDMPLLGAGGGTEGTQPTVNRFDAIVEMTRIDDGTALHTHTLSDFQQSDVQFTAENTTSINGTMTVTLEEGPVENVPVFLTLQNNLISIAVDPVTTESHFGPTPITGIILAPEHLQQISAQLTPTAAEGTSGAGGGAEAGATETGVPPTTGDTAGNTTGP